jgi:adenylate kinase family enzyme
MPAEAKLVAKWFAEAGRDKPLVVYLDVPLAETVKRIAKRKGYNATAKRADDNMVALRNRIKYYRSNIAEVVKFFKTEYHFVKVSGLGTPAQVHRRLKAEIKQHLT